MASGGTSADSAAEPVRQGQSAEPPHPAATTDTSSSPSSPPADEREQMQSVERMEMPEVFSTRRPCHFGSGLASGLKSTAKGVGLGVVTLFAAPAVGAVEGGVGGFFKGLGVGLAGSILLPLSGTAVGAAQIVRGAYNTPGAVKAATTGKHWDRYEREWVTYRPDRALVLDVDDSATDPRSKRRNGDAIADAGGQADELYTRLDVTRESSVEEIRKQYYRKARELHPDKNPDDPEAQARFQRMGEAYQILSNPQLRERYDRDGDVALDESDLVDNSLFFAMLFGSDKFEPLVGQLFMASAASLGEQASERNLQRAQLLRVVTLSRRLRQRLDTAVSHELLAVDAEREARALITASFGDRMLLTIGRAYRSGARVAQGGFGGMAARVGASAHSFWLKASTATSVFGVITAQHRLGKQLEAEEAREAKEASRRASERDARAMDRELLVEEVDDDYVHVSKKSHSQTTAETVSETDARPAAASSPSGQETQETPAKPASAGNELGDASVDPSTRTAPAEGNAAAAAAADVPMDVDDDVSESERDEEERARRFEEALGRAALPHMLKAMWAANELDISQTLQQVTRLATSGGSHGLDKADTATRRERGLRLEVLAAAFLRVATEAPTAEGAAGEPTPEERMERAAQAAAIARSAQYFGEDVDVDELQRAAAATADEEEC